MASLQLLQLTERGRNLLSSRRRTVAVVSGALIAGGTLAYTQSGRWKRQQKTNSSSNGNAHTKDRIGHNGTDAKLVKPRKKKSGLKSLHFLAAILLKKIGPNGSNYLLGLIITAVLRTAVGHRLAKVQGYLFRAAFLRRVPTFTRLIIENLLLCFLQSTIYQTSKYLTGSLGLCFKKILTDLVHADYFEVCWVIKLESINRLHSLLLFFSFSNTQENCASIY